MFGKSSLCLDCVLTAKPHRVMGFAMSNMNLAYCVLEEPLFLLDWNISKLPDRKQETIHKQLAHILDFYRPEDVCLEDVGHPDCKLSKENIMVIREIQQITKNKNIPTRISLWSDVKTGLGLTKKDNMDTVAKIIAKQIPVLFERLPPMRKAWEGEQRVVTLFKAVAFVIALA